MAARLAKRPSAGAVYEDAEIEYEPPSRLSNRAALKLLLCPAGACVCLLLLYLVLTPHSWSASRLQIWLEVASRSQGNTSLGAPTPAIRKAAAKEPSLAPKSESYEEAFRRIEGIGDASSRSLLTAALQTPSGRDLPKLPSDPRRYPAVDIYGGELVEDVGWAPGNAAAAPAVAASSGSEGKAGRQYGPRSRDGASSGSDSSSFTDAGPGSEQQTNAHGDAPHMHQRGAGASARKSRHNATVGVGAVRARPRPGVVQSAVQAAAGRLRRRARPNSNATGHDGPVRALAATFTRARKAQSVDWQENVPAVIELERDGKLRSIQSPAAEAGMEAFGEVWSSEHASGGAAAGPDAAAGSLAGRDCVVALTDAEADMLAALNISAADHTACSQLLQIPRVAILFLTKGELFHEATWAAWFQHAAGAYPLRGLVNNCTERGGGGGCSCPETAALAEKLCAPCKARPLLHQQHLFSVYIHPMPSFGDYPEDSIFHGREIAERVEVEWGSHRLVDAARNLLAAALADPLNQRFILLSESGVPLYPPAAVHAQLAAEGKSRIDSCGAGRTDPWRYSGRMGLKVRSHWRKSSQWVALQRRHAELIAADSEFYPKFEAYCHNAYDTDYGRWRDCFSDEHYFPSLLAYLRLGHETDCIGGLVSVDWSRGGSHPKTYHPPQVSAALFRQLRDKVGTCNAIELIRYSWTAYRTPEDASLPAAEACTAAERHAPLGGADIGYKCPLFARKFPKSASNLVFNLLRGCDQGLLITNAGACSDAIPDQRAAQEQSSRRLLGAVYV